MPLKIGLPLPPQEGTIYERAYVEQEKRIKYMGLLANCIMLDNTVESSTALNALAQEGLIPTIEELAALSPYQTRHIKRFGNYELDLQAIAAPLTDDLSHSSRSSECNDIGVFMYPPSPCCMNEQDLHFLFEAYYGNIPVKYM